MKTEVLFFCLGLALIFGGCVSSPRIPPIGIHPGELRIPDTLEVGDPAPDFKLLNIDGRISLKAKHGPRGFKPGITSTRHWLSRSSHIKK